MDNNHFNPPAWSPHLLQPQHSSPYPSPTSAHPPSFQDSAYYQQPPPSSAGSIPRSSSGLSLNMSSLSVASSNPASVPSTAGALSPVTPHSPATNMTPQQGGFAQHSLQQHTFRFAPPDIVQYDNNQQQQPPYEPILRHPPGSSRSSSESEKSVPRKRSLTTSSMPLSVSVEEDVSFDAAELHTPGSLDESDLGYGVESSPIDGSPSSGEHPDEFRIIESHLGPPGTGQSGSAFSVLGKTSGTNNFVSKLYQMINDPKSAHFICWTELGTSFMVSNVGEFSRSILGSHFKHNNFSSFVRQLNMYGFHKINRTPRAQRSSTDAQTWEFSHPKFLRGRTDLLDDIKRKSLEQDIVGAKQRLELPAEVALQLARMGEDHRRAVAALAAERQRVERLAGVVKVMYDMMAGAFPGQMPVPFPADLVDSSENPPILITSHSHSSHQHHHAARRSPAFNAPLSVPSLTSTSPASSPTAPDFPYPSHYDPEPPSPKRQRTHSVQQHHNSHERKLSRARSDSAPLGHGFGGGGAHAPHPYLGRPRSGSNLAAAPGHVPGGVYRGGRREDGFGLGVAYSVGQAIKDEPGPHPG